MYVEVFALCMWTPGRAAAALLTTNGGPSINRNTCPAPTFWTSFSLCRLYIRSPRRSLTVHASSDYSDQTGESTHTPTNVTNITHTQVLTSSLISCHWRRADCRDPEDRGLNLPRYTRWPQPAQHFEILSSLSGLLISAVLLIGSI